MFDIFKNRKKTGQSKKKTDHNVCIDNKYLSRFLFVSSSRVHSFCTRKMVLLESTESRLGGDLCMASRVI